MPMLHNSVMSFFQEVLSLAGSEVVSSQMRKAQVARNWGQLLDNSFGPMTRKELNVADSQGI